MDKSSFVVDESSVRHHEDMLSSTILVGDEDHKRDELKLSPIFGDSSLPGKVGLRYRHSSKAATSDESSGDRFGDEKERAVLSGLDGSSGYRSKDAQEESSQIEIPAGDAAFIEEVENSEGSEKEKMRTPENSHSGTRLINDSKYANPFDISSIHSLSQSIFSPGILAELSNLPKNTPKANDADSFKWSIEHLAILNPVDIPEEDIVRSRISPSSFLDSSRQAAIDKFFSSTVAHHPSPDPFRRPTTPSTAPSAAKRLRRVEALAGGGGSASPSPSPSSFHIPSCLLQPSPLTRPAGARILRAPSAHHHARTRTVSTQTAVTIPPRDEMDLVAVLGARYAYDEAAERERRMSEGVIEEEDEERDLSASNLSLPRRLFLNDGEEEEEEEEMETSVMRREAKDVLTPLSSDITMSSLSNNRSSSLLEDLGHISVNRGHSDSPSSSLRSPCPSRLGRIPFPDFSPIGPN